VFSIATGKSVVMNGFEITCSQGNIDGRCIYNHGNLTLDNLNMIDINGSTTGSTLWNSPVGHITIEKKVDIIR